MPEEPREPESEKPRFLLPEGCKDLSDMLAPENELPAKDSMPNMIIIPEQISARNLAAALNLTSVRMITELMGLNVFVTSLDANVDFETASTICRLHGIAAMKRA